MKPRYEVILDYPQSNINPFVMGDLLIENGIHFTRQERAKSIHKDEIIKYPKIFRPIQWWEKREAADMPEYVKYAKTGEVKEVSYFDFETTSSWFMYLNGEPHPYCPGGSALEGTHWLPATLSDYTLYLNQQNTPHSKIK